MKAARLEINLARIVSSGLVEGRPFPRRQSLRIINSLNARRKSARCISQDGVEWHWAINRPIARILRREMDFWTVIIVGSFVRRGTNFEWTFSGLFFFFFFCNVRWGSNFRIWIFLRCIVEENKVISCKCF